MYSVVFFCVLLLGVLLSFGGVQLLGLAALFFCFLHRFWDLISICSCPESCISQLQIPCGVRSTDATAKRGGIPDGFYNASGSVGVGTDTQS